MVALQSDSTFKNSRIIPIGDANGGRAKVSFVDLCQSPLCRARKSMFVCLCAAPGTLATVFRREHSPDRWGSGLGRELPGFASQANKVPSRETLTHMPTMDQQREIIEQEEFRAGSCSEDQVPIWLSPHSANHLSQRFPVDLSVVVAMFYIWAVQDGSQRSHVAVESLKCGYCM